MARIWNGGKTSIETYCGAMYVFDDGDPDKVPMHLATDKDIREGTIEEGWFARWRGLTLDDSMGCWMGPFETEVLAVSAAHKDFFEGTYADQVSEIEERLQAAVVSGEP